MPKTMKVEIDGSGHVRGAEDGTAIPEGRALLTWPAPAGEDVLLMSEAALAEDWLRPEEDAAWAHLQS